MFGLLGKLALVGAITATFFVQSALALDFLSEEQLKATLVGNTIETIPTRGDEQEPVFIYFGADGEAEYATARSSNVQRGTWSIKLNPEVGTSFCRERPFRPFNDAICERVTSDGQVLKFYTHVHRFKFSAKILNGRQLP